MSPYEVEDIVCTPGSHTTFVKFSPNSVFLAVGDQAPSSVYLLDRTDKTTDCVPGLPRSGTTQVRFSRSHCCGLWAASIGHHKWGTIGWMDFYIFAIPAFSFLPPLYSFWWKDNF